VLRREGAACASFENTVMIRRSIEDVFGFLSDFENVPTWNYAISETHKVSQGPVGVGAIYQQVRSVPSRSEERFEVSAYNPPRHLEIQGQLGPFPSRLSYALDAVPEGTRVTNSVELELRGPGRLLGRVAVPRIRDAVAANLRKLKELLER
jgi:carbon monoxide dehydrogenase subunit G